MVRVGPALAAVRRTRELLGTSFGALGALGALGTSTARAASSSSH